MMIEIYDVKVDIDISIALMTIIIAIAWYLNAFVFLNRISISSSPVFGISNRVRDMDGNFKENVLHYKYGRVYHSSPGKKPVGNASQGLITSSFTISNNSNLNKQIDRRLQQRQNQLMKIPTQRFMHVRYDIAEEIQDAPKILRLSASSLGAMIKEGQLTSEQLCRMCIDQILKVNPSINAVIAFRLREALEESKRADQILKETGGKDLSPFFGVPMVIKEVYEMKGLPFTGGVASRRGIVGKNTCPAVQRAIDAGIIILGSSNISEACMWMESDNAVYGRTNNPYDLERTVGGSSGGCAASVASLCSPFSIASDVGGSIRIPSFFCGVFGHKPTGGAVSNMGTYPTVHNRVNYMCQLGPMSKHSEDLMPLLRLIAGPMTKEERQRHEDLHHEGTKYPTRVYNWPDISTVNISSLKVVNVMDQPTSSQWLPITRHPELLEKQIMVADHLMNKYNCAVYEKVFSKMNYAFEIWASTLHVENPVAFSDIISEGKDGYNTLVELFRYLLGFKSDHTLPALGLALVERLTDLAPGHTKKLIKLGEELKEEISRELGNDGIMIFPTLPRLAPHHGPIGTLIRFTDCAATAILNALEFPCTAVPLGLSEVEGLPTGVQIVANHGNDHLCIAVAVQLEKDGLAKWTPPRI